jgi:heat shock factor-binding protein 1
MQQSKFTQMSQTIIGRIDEMGSRIDELEKSVSELMQQTEATTSTSTKQ